MNPPLLDNILAQPSAWEEVANYQSGAGRAAMMRSVDLLRNSKRIVLTGMGASLFACIPFQYMLGHHGVAVSVVETAELLHFLSPALERDTIVVFVSRSGESVEILKLADLLNERGCRSIGVVNVYPSALTARTSECIVLNCPPDELVAIQTYTATLLALALLAAAYLNELAAAHSDLKSVVSLLPEWVADCLAASENWKRFSQPATPLYILGRGPALASVNAGVLLRHEVAKSPAVGMSIAQFRHGPVEVTDDEFRALIIGTQRVTSEIDRQLAHDLWRMGGSIRWLGPLPDGSTIEPLCAWPQNVPDRFAGLFETLPLQFLAYRAAEAQDITPGQFRWASAVTSSESGFPECLAIQRDQTDEPDLIPIGEFPSEPETEVVLALLESNGIPAVRNRSYDVRFHKREHILVPRNLFVEATRVISESKKPEPEVDRAPEEPLTEPRSFVTLGIWLLAIGGIMYLLFASLSCGAVPLAIASNKLLNNVSCAPVVRFTLLAFILLMLASIVDRFVYYPMRYPQGEWDLQTAAGAQDLWCKTADGVRLNAWWFPQPDAHFATLFLHGNAGNVTHRIDHAHAIQRAGSAILVLDYRGYGKSEGHPSERGLYMDADAAYDALLQLGLAPNRIVLHGESLGTAVAAELALRRPCAGLILESPMASLSEMAGTVLPIIGPLFAHGFETRKRIRQVRAPLLVIHGDADEIVPFSQGQSVFSAANQPKEFWRVLGAHHNDLLYVAGDEYTPRLRAFYKALAP